MRSGLVFLTGICCGILVAWGSLCLGQFIVVKNTRPLTLVLSQQEIAELRQLQAHLKYFLGQTSKHIVRRPVTYQVRMGLKPGASATLYLPQASTNQQNSKTPAMVAQAPAPNSQTLEEQKLTPPLSHSSGPSTPINAAQLYAQGLQAYEQGHYLQARKDLACFIHKFAHHKLIPNAWYWTGETWYAQGHYMAAHNVFLQVKDRFPEHAKSADALLKMAYSQIRLGNEPQARIYLDLLEAVYPQSSAAQLGQQARKQLQGQLNVSLRLAHQR